MSRADIFTPDPRQLVLEHFAFQNRLLMANHVLVQATGIERFLMEKLQQTVFQLHTTVVGKELAEIVVRVPASPWQALKARRAPGWFLRRWPVQHVEVRVDVAELYPEFPNLPIPHGEITRLMHVPLADEPEFAKVEFVYDDRVTPPEVKGARLKAHDLAMLTAWERVNEAAWQRALEEREPDAVYHRGKLDMIRFLKRGLKE